jgi:vaccinia related kinase
VLSRKFNINLSDVEDVINTFDRPNTGPIPVPKKKKTPTTPKRAQTKDDLLKEAKALGLKINTKMRKDEIHTVLDRAAAGDAAKAVIAPPVIIPVITPHPSQVPKPSQTPPRPRTPQPTPMVNKMMAPAPMAAPVVSAPVQKPEFREPGSLEGESFKSPLVKKEWKFGKLLGTGGFGAVYEVEGNPDLVIKTGRDHLKKGQDSGVFFEKSVYIKLRDPEGEGDKHGIPQIVDSGRLPRDLKDREYFIVMPRFEFSLDDMIKTGTLTPQDRKKVINDVLDAFKYLSKKGYIHLDVKAENIMKKKDRWFLIDYGMASRFNTDTETTINPKKAGDGTPWYMSRDTHKGLQSRKSDLESLVYTLVEMEGYTLPWRREKEKKEKIKDYHQFILESKDMFFDTYKNLNLPQYYNTFIEQVDKLQPGTDPNYDALKLK